MKMPDAGTKPIILAVDDAPENLDVVKAALGDEYVVRVAINGKIALKIAEKQLPDLILLDIMMPVMSGFEVFRRLKANKRTAGIPVVFLTGEKHHSSESMAFDMGAEDYVMKPINPTKLRACIKDALS
ncbi:MAG: PleD family two-component response regulator [Lysobacterales bacterium]|jgi:PleD family two-component response regulator